MNARPLISVIVPVHNGSQYLNQCLDALGASASRSFEVIVVDDASNDESAEIARRKWTTVFQLPKQSGPAAARNHGARQARGEILFFVDADVVVQPETIGRVIAGFQQNPDVVAIFGSYDDAPAERNFCSQYKNLYHHFVHQQSNCEAATFWAGCGAIRREVFHAVGGFDQQRYPKPSIEDIELGYRLRTDGYRILLDKELLVKHLKRWTFGGLLRTDIFHRAIPWSKLMLENQQLVNDLNLKTADRVSAGLVGLSVGLLPCSIFSLWWLSPIPLFLAIVLGFNQRLYAFFLQQRGFLFAVLAFPMQLLYYLYSGVTFLLCWCDHHWFTITRR